MKTTRVIVAGLLALVAPLPLAQVAAAEAATLAHPPAEYAYDRVVHLEGGQNFRDLGGYPATGGRYVRWGLLFRSGSMYRLTPADFSLLDTLGIKTVVDFRSQEERQTEPVNWPTGHVPRVLSVDYSLNQRGLLLGDLTSAEIGTKVVAMYPSILAQFKGEYRRMFAELLNGSAPLVFNCSGGRDRTGIAAALLLTALGVPRETIIQDYLLTSRYLDLDRTGPSAQTWQDKSGANPQEIKAAIREVMLSTARPSIEAIFKVIDANPGGAEGYLHDEFGLGAADFDRLRAMYTE